MIRERPLTFPQIEIKFDQDNAASTPIILHVRPHLDLLFSSRYQRLHTISVRRLRDPSPPVTIRYKDSVLSSSQETLRRVGVSKTFGPTFPAAGLRYPGVWFSFDEDGMGDGIKRSDERKQEVKSLVIQQKTSDDQEQDPLAEVHVCPVMYTDLSSVDIRVSLYIIYHVNMFLTCTPII